MLLLCHYTQLCLCSKVYTFHISVIKMYNFHIPSDINECASKPCQNGGKCDDYVNDYFCTCPKGYVGKNCETSKRYYYILWPAVLCRPGTLLYGGNFSFNVCFFSEPASKFALSFGFFFLIFFLGGGDCKW